MSNGEALRFTIHRAREPAVLQIRQVTASIEETNWQVYQDLLNLRSTDFAGSGKWSSGNSAILIHFSQCSKRHRLNISVPSTVQPAHALR